VLSDDHRQLEQSRRWLRLSLRHPEWIDFPREGNQWSFRYARRQWHLADDPFLRYHYLARFDQDMIALGKDRKVPDGQELFLLQLDQSAKVLAFMRGEVIFVLNFHPNQSLTDHWIPASPGGYQIVLDTDRGAYGGLDRQDLGIVHRTITDRIHRHFLSLYLPARTAMVMAPVSEGAEP